MKKIGSLLTCVILIANSLSAQLKHDYVWTMGYHKISPIPSGGAFGGIIMDFKTSPPSFALQDYICARPRAAISDKNGVLIAYTEGCRIMNRNHEIMSNGDTLNPGAVFNA